MLPSMGDMLTKRPSHSILARRSFIEIWAAPLRNKANLPRPRRRLRKPTRRRKARNNLLRSFFRAKENYETRKKALRHKGLLLFLTSLAVSVTFPRITRPRMVEIPLTADAA